MYGQTITLTATVTAGSPATVYTVNSTGSGSSGTGTSGTLPYVIGQADLNPNLAGSVIQFDPDRSSSASRPADDHSDQHAGAGRPIRAAGDRRPRRGRGHDQRRQRR